MAAQPGTVAKFKIGSAAATTSTGEAMTSLSGTTDRFLFRITDKTKRHWSKLASIAPTVYVLTTAHTDFAVNHVQGKVTFGTALSTVEGDAVTVDARFHTVSYLGFTRSWTLNHTADMLDTTVMSTSTAAAQWKTFREGLSEGNVDLGRIIEANTSSEPAFFDRLNTDTPLIVELIAHVSGTTHKWEAWGRVSGDSYTTPIDGLIEAAPTVVLDGPLFYETTE